MKLRAERWLGELIQEQVDHTGGGDRKSVFHDATPILDSEGVFRNAVKPPPGNGQRAGARARHLRRATTLS